jgi:hypothetical protein
VLLLWFFFWMVVILDIRIARTASDTHVVSCFSLGSPSQSPKLNPKPEPGSDPHGLPLITRNLKESPPLPEPEPRPV